VEENLTDFPDFSLMTYGLYNLVAAAQCGRSESPVVSPGNCGGGRRAVAAAAGTLQCSRI